MTEEYVAFALRCAVGITALLALVHFIYQNIQGHRRSKLPVETARATVYLKHPEPEYVPGAGTRYNSSGSYIYHITFHTENGLILKLYLNPDQFYTLTEHDTGLLTWQGERFWNFIPDVKKES